MIIHSRKMSFMINALFSNPLFVYWLTENNEYRMCALGGLNMSTKFITHVDMKGIDKDEYQKYVGG